METLRAAHATGAAMHSLAEPWADSTIPASKMVMTVFADIVEFSPRRSITSQPIETARELLDEGYTAVQAGEAVGISSTPSAVW